MSPGNAGARCGADRVRRRRGRSFGRPRYCLLRGDFGAAGPDAARVPFGAQCSRRRPHRRPHRAHPRESSSLRLSRRGCSSGGGSPCMPSCSAPRRSSARRGGSRGWPPSRWSGTVSQGGLPSLRRRFSWPKTGRAASRRSRRSRRCGSCRGRARVSRPAGCGCRSWAGSEHATYCCVWIRSTPRAGRV